MNIKFVDEARSEFLDAISYYEEQQAGLCRRFKAEVERTLLWLVEHPEVCPLRPNAYRRLNLRISRITFPTSFEVRLCGSLQLLMTAVGLNIGFNEKRGLRRVPFLLFYNSKVEFLQLLFIYFTGRIDHQVRS